ncbi:MAG: hypothetical protein V7765_21880 [Oleispira sp.]
MLKILLPLLMLFSMSSFANLVSEPSYAAPGYLDADSVVITEGCQERPCVSENEPFDRLYIVTGAATQYLESITAQSGLTVKMANPPHEVGWRSTEII